MKLLIFFVGLSFQILYGAQPPVSREPVSSERSESREPVSNERSESREPRPSLDLSVSTTNLPEYDQDEAGRNYKEYVCSLCKRSYSRESLAITRCGHACCIYCFYAEDPATLYCGICQKVLYIRHNEFYVEEKNDNEP